MSTTAGRAYQTSGFYAGLVKFPEAVMAFDMVIMYYIKFTIKVIDEYYY